MKTENSLVGNPSSNLQASASRTDSTRSNGSFIDSAARLIQPDGNTSPQIDWKAKETAAINRAALTEFRQKLDSLANLNLTTSEFGQTLGSELNLLKTSEQGAKIASDLELVDQYVALSDEFENIVESGDDVATYLAELLPLIQQVEDSKDYSYRPQAYTVEQVEKLSTSLKNKTKSLRELKSGLASIISAADSLTPAKPLQITIAKVEKERVESKARRLSEATRTAREKETAKHEDRIAQTEAALAKSKADLAVERNRTQISGNQIEADKIKAKRLADEEGKRIAAAKKKLESEFQAELANIKTYLQPFLYEARSIRGNLGGKGPASYSALDSGGALADTNQGIYQFYRAASMFDDRPISGYGGMHSIYAVSYTHLTLPTKA